MTFSPEYKRELSRAIPVPIVELRDRQWANASAFDGTTLTGFEEIWVRNPDFSASVFDPANQPVLELAWYRRKVGTGYNRQSRAENQGWAAPDDSTIKFGSDQGGGSQTAVRRSKWSVTSTKDFEFISGARIELEHYFKTGLINLLEDNVGSSSQIKIPVPTFVDPSRWKKAFSAAQHDPQRSVPKYHGYQNGYFRFFYSIKDPLGKHPGDRISGAMSEIICVRAAKADRGFPIWPAANGFAKGEDAVHLKAFIV